MDVQPVDLSVLSTTIVDMSNPLLEATPRATLSAATTIPNTQWFAVHYTAEADASLPRAVFANAVSTEDERTLRFFLTVKDQAPRVVFEVASDHVVRCTPHPDVRSALSDAFAAESHGA